MTPEIWKVKEMPVNDKDIQVLRANEGLSEDSFSRLRPVRVGGVSDEHHACILPRPCKLNMNISVRIANVAKHN